MKWLTYALLLIAAVLGGLLLARQFARPPLTGGTSLDTPLRVPALSLVSDTGAPTTLAASDGRMRLLFFGYVHCPDVCPATLASLKNTYAALTPEQQKRVQVQFITVDPVQDTPKLMREYLNKFDSRFTGLTGESATIDKAAEALYVANVKPAGEMNHMNHDMPAGQTQQAEAHGSDNHADNQVSAAQAARIHGDEVRVITPAGDFVRVYNNIEAIDGTLQKDLPALIAQYSHSS